MQTAEYGVQHKSQFNELCSKHVIINHISSHTMTVRLAAQKLHLWHLQHRSDGQSVLQASLLVRNGGLWIRRMSSLVPSALLASAAGIQALGHASSPGWKRGELLCTNRIWHVRIDWSNTGLLDFEVHTTWFLCPDSILRLWANYASRPNHASLPRSITRCLVCLTDSHARPLGLSAPHSGDWLHANPSHTVVFNWTTRLSES